MAALSIAARTRPRLPAALRVTIGIAALLLMAAAFAPWTVDTQRFTGRLNGQLEAAYGARIEARGRSSIAFLPVPRIKIAKAAILDEGGRALVADAQLRGELRLLPLLLGHLELQELSITGGRIAVDGGETGWDEALARLKGRPEGGRGIRRLVVAGSDLTLRTASGEAETLRRLDLVASWPGPDGDLDLAGQALWRDETVTGSISVRRPLQLGEGRASAFDLQASAKSGRVAMRGEISRRDGWRFDGQTSGEAASLGALARWLGGSAAPAGLDVPVAFGGGATLTAAEVGWSRLHVDLRGDTLEGALSVRFGARGAAARATLAAGRLDLGWLAQAGLPSLTAWAEGSAPARLPPESRLDLRLSASSLRIGEVKLGESALSVLVDEGRLDVALLHAGLDRGAIKGRLVASLDGPRPDLKGQLSFEGIDAASLMAIMGKGAWLAGTARGQASFEMPGGRDLLRQVAGRMSVTLSDGDVAGLNLGATLRRASAEGPSQALRSGRTAFARAQLNVTLANGIAEIEDGSQIQGDAFRAALQGRIALPERLLSLRADASIPGPPASRMVIDVNGPWSAPVVQRGVEPAALQDGP